MHTQPTSLVAVCRWFHSRRVLMTLKKHLPGIICYTATYDSPTDSQGNFIPAQIEKAKIEFQKIPIYLKNGDLEEL